MKFDAEQFAKQKTVLGRIKFLLKTSEGLFAAFATVLGLLAFVTTLESARHVAEVDTKYEESRYRLGATIFDNALEIAQARVNVAKILETMPESRERSEIEKQLGAMDPPLVGLRALGEAIKEQSRGDRRKSSLSLIGSASAAEDQKVAKFTIEDARPYGMLIVLIALGLTFCGAIVTILFATDQEKLKFAFDIVKTLLGFFTGVATSFFGGAPH